MKRTSPAKGSSKPNKKIKSESSDNEDGEIGHTITGGSSSNDSEVTNPSTPSRKKISAKSAIMTTPNGNSKKISAPKTPMNGKQNGKATTPSSVVTPSFSDRTPRSSTRKTPAISYAELNDPYEKMEREGLFNDKEMIEGASSITLGEEIIDDGYSSDGTEDEYKLEDAVDAATDDMELKA